jgi:hypothetical protein
VRSSAGKGHKVRVCLCRHPEPLRQAPGDFARGLQGVGFELANRPDGAADLARQLILRQVEGLAPSLQPLTK